MEREDHMDYQMPAFPREIVAPGEIVNEGVAMILNETNLKEYLGVMQST